MIFVKTDFIYLLHNSIGFKNVQKGWRRLSYVLELLLQGAMNSQDYSHILEGNMKGLSPLQALLEYNQNLKLSSRSPDLIQICGIM